MMRVGIVAQLDTSALCRLPRLFHDAGYEVWLIGPASLTGMRSRFVHQRISSTTITGKPDLIVPADEPSSRAFALEPVQFLLDAVEAGIRMPACELCDSFEAALDAAQILGFPVFLKPGGYAGSPAEIKALNPAPPVLVQKHHGDCGSIALFYEQGEARCWFGYLNRGAAIEVFSHPDLDKTVERAGRLLKFTGLCHIEFTFNRDRDEVSLASFNPWPDPCCHLGRLAGVDFALALRHWADANETGAHETQVPLALSRNAAVLFPEGLGDASQFVPCLRSAPWSDPALVFAELMNHRRLSASSSSRLRGQSDPSSRDRPRSASTLPPV